MTELGSGIALDEDWDMYIDESDGDVAISEGSEELRKDLAFIVARALRNVSGSTVSDGDAADVRLHLRKVILTDDRVETINNIETDRDSASGDFSIDITATTVTGEEIEQVFEV